MRKRLNVIHSFASTASIISAIYAIFLLVDQSITQEQRVCATMSQITGMIFDEA